MQEITFDLQNTQPVIEIVLINKFGGISKPVKAILDTGSYYSFVSSHWIDETFVKTGKELPYQVIDGNKGTGEEYQCRIAIPLLSDKTSFDFYFLVKNTVYDHFDVIIGSRFLSDFEIGFCLKGGKVFLSR